VHTPLARVPADDISASSSRPRPRGLPTDFRPSMMPAPGTWGHQVMFRMIGGSQPVGTYAHDIGNESARAPQRLAPMMPS
jgi:hypothetical protein